jgi:8-oxo-dGTP pyrophosphatase MutT (NUDIX family)
MRQDKSWPFLESLEARLKEPKPGLAAQLKMVPEPRPGQKTYDEVQDTCRPAAVLILIYPHRGKRHLVLTLRTSRVDHHRDQVSLPGGEKDGRETVVEAALRETAEELGVRASDIRVLGQLTPLYVPPSNFCIFPVIAAAEKRPRFRRAPAEVAEIIDLPLDVLNDPTNIRREAWRLRDQETVVPFYAFGGHKIWGATAMVLAEFAEIITGL